jgi:phosphoribosylformylglycinamidine synthase
MNRKARVIVLRTAGTNCDNETCYAFHLAGAEAALVHVNRLFSKQIKMGDYDILAIPGGFSYGDDVAAGKILANELKWKLREDVKKFAGSGKPVIGICNGFQVLVKLGLLPGFEVIDERQEVTLTWNDSGKFECRWVWLKNKENKCIFTKDVPALIYLPVAHAEGKFYTGDETVIKKITDNNQIVFTYVNDKGEEPSYPDNPNGSLGAIAGITNPAGNVFGLMPHPERFISKYQHPRWRRENITDTGDGLKIFKNAVEFVISGR